MIVHVKKYGIIALMAILFTAFSFSIVDVVKERPDYQDFCPIEARQVMKINESIPIDNTCHTGYDEAWKQHRKVGFIITGILGIIAIIAGMYATSKKEVLDWIYSGLLIGGMLTLTFGTISYFRDMSRFAKPIILLVEMAIIAWVAIITTKKRK